MTSAKKNLFEYSCYWLTILLPLSIACGRGVADTTLSLSAISFAIYLITQKNINPLKEKWFLIALALWVYLLVRSVFSEHILLALKKSIPFLRLPLFALCVQYLATTHKDLNKNLYTSLLIAVCFLTIDGYIQFIFGKEVLGRSLWDDGKFYRLTGPFSKPVLGATISILSMPILAVALKHVTERKHALIFLLLSAAIFIIVFISGERSALIQMILGILLISIVSIKNKKAILYTALAGIAVLVAMYSFKFDKVINRQIFSIFEILQNYSDSPYGKLWNSGIEIGLNNIIFGVGPMHFESHCEAISDLCKYHPHNIYIEFFAETGIVGLSLVVLLFYTIIKDSIAAYRTQIGMTKFLILGTLTSVMIKLLPVPSSGFFKNWFAIPLWLMIAWLLSLNKNNESK